MKTFLPTAFLKGKFIPFSEANISIATHALHYGTGAFGGMRAFPNPKNDKEILLFRPENHAKRLSNSAKILGYDLSAEYIEEKIFEFIKLNKPTKPIYIRPLVYTSDLDITPRLYDIEKDFLIYGLELGDYLPAGEGVTCTISSYRRQSDVSFPLRGKITGGYITSALAKAEAHERGFDEAIMLNDKNKVSEGTGMNIFIVKNGKIITPGVTQDILEGITRDSVMKLAKYLGYEVEEREVDKSELFLADEVFLTGTAARVTAVSKIEQYNLPKNKPIFSTLKENFEKLVRGEIREFENFVVGVEI